MDLSHRPDRDRAQAGIEQEQLEVRQGPADPARGGLEVAAAMGDQVTCTVVSVIPYMFTKRGAETP